MTVSEGVAWWWLKAVVLCVLSSQAGGPCSDHTGGGRTGEVSPRGGQQRTSSAGTRCVTIPELNSIRALHDVRSGWSSGLTIQTWLDECGVGENL